MTGAKNTGASGREGKLPERDPSTMASQVQRPEVEAAKLKNKAARRRAVQNPFVKCGGRLVDANEDGQLNVGVNQGSDEQIIVNESDEAMDINRGSGEMAPCKQRVSISARRGRYGAGKGKTSRHSGFGRRKPGSRAGKRAGVKHRRAKLNAGARAGTARGHGTAPGRRRGKRGKAVRRTHSPAPQSKLPQALPAGAVGAAQPQAGQAQPRAAAGGEGAAGARGSAKGVPPQAAKRAARDSSYAAGFRDGVYAGGEALVEQRIPPDHILPDVAAAELIAAGVNQYAPRLARLAGPHEVAAHIYAALDAGRPLSVIRLGDGELLALAADTVLSSEEVQELAPFLPYAGVQRSTPDVRASLAEAIRRADWVGVPISRAPTFQGLLFPVLRHFAIDWSSLKLTDSTINYSLHHSRLLPSLLQNRRVLVIGDLASELGALLQSHGVLVAGMIAPVAGYADIPRVMQRIRKHDFDLALVAAGIPAIVLCRYIADELGKVAIDFGHLANKLVTGELQY